MQRFFFYFLLIILIGIIILKLSLIGITYYNIDYFVYSYIADVWNHGKSTHFSAQFPPINSGLQFLLQYILKPQTIDGMIIISNIIGFIFSSLSVYLVYKFAKFHKLSNINIFLVLLLVITVPYVFFQASFGDTGNIYGFFIALLFYLRFTKGYETSLNKFLILLTCLGLLLSRKESFIVVAFFFFFEFILSRKKIEVLKLGLLFGLCFFIPLVFVFYKATGHYYYIEVETMFKGILGMNVTSYSDIHKNMLQNYIVDSNVTGIKAWLINSSQHSQYIFYTFVTTISSIIAVLGFGGFIKKFQEDTAKNKIYLVPICIIIGILAIYFYLGKGVFQGAIYDIKTFFYIDGFQSFQRYFMPFLGSFSFGLIFYLKKNDNIVMKSMIVLGIIMNIIIVGGDYYTKWRFAHYDNYVNPVSVYGGLDIPSYIRSGEVELYKFLKKSEINGNIFYPSPRNDSGQLLTRFYLIGSKNSSLITYFNKGEILPSSISDRIMIEESGFYLIKNNFSQMNLLLSSSDEEYYLKKIDVEMLGKLNIKYIQIDTDISNPEIIFENMEVKKIFSYDTIELYELIK